MADASAAQGSNYTGPIVIDPVTRLEGHLRIEVEVTNGKVSNAYSSVTLFRGLEMILKGRDPQDAQHIAQRTCGVCTYLHALGSIRSVDHAVGVTLPPLAVKIRNLVLAAQCLHDHIVHFYHLHALDFVNVANCLNADPVKAAKIATSISKRKITLDAQVKEFKAVQERIRKFVDNGQLGPFTGAYFFGDPHPSYRLTPELDLIGTAHYLEALRMQVKVARACAVFGAKHPHPQFTVVGGVTCYDSLRPERIKEFSDLIDETEEFVNNIYIPDVLAIGGEYKDVAEYGGTHHFMGCGEYSDDPNAPEKGFIQGGIIYNRNLGKVLPFNSDLIQEHVRHSWYKGEEAHHPYKGDTDPAFTDLHGDERYSWSKAPRYEGNAVETGPLATVLLNYAQGNQPYVDATKLVLDALSVTPDALYSTLGRTAGRAIQSKVLADQLKTWITELKEQIKKEPNPKLVSKWEMPQNAQGVGFVNAPRGMLSHWINIEKGKIENYQLVVPSTWNLGPRCANNKIGPVEEALIGTPVADAKRPVEILRTVHSFDPCLACAVHVIDPQSNEERVFKIL